MLAALILAVGLQAAGSNELQHHPRGTGKVSLEAHLSSFVGADTIDCGTHTRAGGIPAEMVRSLECAQRARSAGKAFRIVQRGPGEDSDVAFGVLGRADGSVLWFDYDSGPCGGPLCPDRFETKPCAISEVAVVDEAGGYHTFRCGPAAGTDNVATFSSYVRAERWDFVITRETLNQTPLWAEAEDVPPLPVRRAMSIAARQLAGLVSDAERWRFAEVSLRPIGEPRHWVYVVDYSEPPPSPEGGLTSRLALLVLMDGTAVAPSRTPWPRH